MFTSRISNPALIIVAVALAAALAALMGLRRDHEARTRATPMMVAGQAGPLEAGALAQFGISQGPLGQPPGAAPAASRPRGQYTLLSGRMLGSNANAIFILDTTNQELVGVKWDQAARKLTGIGYRNLVADAESTGKGTGR